MAKARPGSFWPVVRRPLLVWAALCALLAATYTIAYIPLGAANLPISLAIAAAKAALVGFFFMRLREDTPLNRLAAFVGPMWVFIMFILIGADYFTR